MDSVEPSALVPKTNNYVLQICRCTHGVRIDRHNTMAAYICCNLRRQCFTVEEKPYYRTMEDVPEISKEMPAGKWPGTVVLNQFF